MQNQRIIRFSFNAARQWQSVRFMSATRQARVVAIAIAPQLKNSRHWSTLGLATAAAGVVSWQVSMNRAFADQEANPQTVTDPDSKLEFPLVIKASDGQSARLLGLGVRKITFLKVQVYVVGLYAKESEVKNAVKSLPELAQLQKDDLQKMDVAFAALIKKAPVELTLRIAPTRPTNGPHLRDGFTRNLTQQAKDQKLSQEQNDNAMDAILQFKSLFPKGKINVGQSMRFTRVANGSMTIHLDDEHLGTIGDRWLVETFFLGYLNTTKPISKKASASIAEGLERLRA